MTSSQANSSSRSEVPPTCRKASTLRCSSTSMSQQSMARRLSQPQTQSDNYGLFRLLADARYWSAAQLLPQPFPCTRTSETPRARRSPSSSFQLPASSFQSATTLQGTHVHTRALPLPSLHNTRNGVNGAAAMISYARAVSGRQWQSGWTYWDARRSFFDALEAGSPTRHQTNWKVSSTMLPLTMALQTGTMLP